MIELTIIALILAIAGDIARRAWAERRARKAWANSPKTSRKFSEIALDHWRHNKPDRPEDYCA
jgi:hypothetical protein